MVLRERAVAGAYQHGRAGASAIGSSETDGVARAGFIKNLPRSVIMLQIHKQGRYMDGYASSVGEGEIDMDFAAEPPPLVRFDERRMHVRAYNYWASLLGDRNFPSIEDLNPEEIEDFGSHSVLLDFTGGLDNPVVAFLGAALRVECGVDGVIDRISDVPPRTLLSRLTDHYMQILANEAPIGFEAEFTNQRGADILYRGILMPFSSDDDSIDFIYGVINWKEVAATAMTDDIARAMGELNADTSQVSIEQVWGGDPAPGYRLSAEDQAGDALSARWAGVGDPLSDALDNDTDDDDADDFGATLDLDPFIDPFGKALHDARRAAAEAISFESRSHQALYRAVGLAHSFAILAAARPEDYTVLVAQAGIAVQPRSPMTALVKLVFGSDYDKTRLSEFAAVIDYALAHKVEAGALEALLTAHDGGIKGYVALARATRRGGEAVRPVAKGQRLRKRLLKAQAIGVDTVTTDDSGFAVVLMRREADGSMSALGGIPADDRRALAVFRAVADQRG